MGRRRKDKGIGIIQAKINDILEINEDDLTIDQSVIKSLYMFIKQNIRAIKLNRDERITYKAILARNQKKWSEIEKFYLTENAGKKTFDEVCKDMKDRTQGSIKLQIYRLGLADKYFKGVQG